MTRRTLWMVVLMALGAGLVGCDHASKDLAREHLSDGSTVPLVNERVALRYVENPGMGFSLERWLDAGTRRWALPLTRGLALLLLGWLSWRRRRQAGRLEQVGFVLLAAGALGNGLERLSRGVVIDFIQIRGWPVFNFADVYLTVGVALLGWALWRAEIPRAHGQ